MKVISVVLDIQNASLSREFSFVALNSNEASANSKFSNYRKKYIETVDTNRCNFLEVEAEVGSVVLVPFGRQLRCGFVVDDCSVEEFQKSKRNIYDLHPIVGVVATNVFTAEGAEISKFVAQRYMCSRLQALRLVMPPGAIYKACKGDHGWFVKTASADAVSDKWVCTGPEIDKFTPRKTAKKQISIIKEVQKGDIKLADLSKKIGSISGPIKKLIDNNVIKVQNRKRVYINDVPDIKFDENNFNLTDGQISALDAIRDACSSNICKKIVLDGVTGSGKTEVYIRAIADVIKQGKSAILLVPEISLTPQTVNRFTKCFGENVAVLHSRLTKSQKYEEWNRIINGGASIVIGPRSALFAPLKNLGLIVIDEEHSETYKQDTNPRYDARICGEHMCESAQIPLVMGSATPSIRALYNCKNYNDWQHIRMPERTNGMPLPAIELVDMTLEFKGGSKSVFSYKLKEAIISTTQSGKKTMLLYNRRGFANYMFCRNCGYIPKCPNCDVALTFHGSNVNSLVCHHCGHAQVPPVKCPECGSVYVAKLGAGTQGIEDSLHELLNAEGLSNVPIIRMDSDVTQTKTHAQILEEFQKPGPAILLGTQMIAKGLDIPDVTLVGIVLADTELNLPDYSSAAKTFNMICQVAGRSGRADDPGRVIVQSYKADEPSIALACAYNRGQFMAEELPKRQLLHYPPFYNLVNIVVTGPNEDAVVSCADTLYENLEQDIQSLEKVECLAPTPCVLSKLKNQYRYHILVKIPVENTELTQIVKKIGQIVSQIKHSKYIHIYGDVDPASLM